MFVRFVVLYRPAESLFCGGHRVGEEQHWRALKLERKATLEHFNGRRCCGEIATKSLPCLRCVQHTVWLPPIISHVLTGGIIQMVCDFRECVTSVLSCRVESLRFECHEIDR